MKQGNSLKHPWLSTAGNYSFPLSTLHIQHWFSDGLSCSGIVIAIDIGRRQLENDSTVDISNIVANMRQDRRGMILTKEQYIYIYQVTCNLSQQINKANGMCLGFK